MSHKGALPERLAVVAICFGWTIASSTWSVIAGERKFDYTTEAMVMLIVSDLVFAFAAIALLWSRGWRLEDLRLRPSFLATAAALPLFLVAHMLSRVIWIIVWRSGMAADWKDVDFTMTAPPALVLAFMILNSFYEEIFVVGYLIEATPEKDVALAVSTSTLVRLLYHTYQGPAALSTALPLGLLFAIVYARWRNLWPLIVAHTLLNLASWAASSIR